MNTDKKSFIHIPCERYEKASWVKAAIRQNLKLSAWVVKTLNDAAKNQINLK